jgi:hypothetical protein
MAEFGECEVVAICSNITLKEKKCRMNFRNPQQSKVRRVRIDGCVIKDERPRCDWLVISQDLVEHYVELKGADIKRAIEQIEATIKAVGEYESGRKAFIISTHVPMLTTSVQQAKKKVWHNYKAKLEIVEINHTADIA